MSQTVRTDCLQSWYRSWSSLEALPPSPVSWCRWVSLVSPELLSLFSSAAAVAAPGLSLLTVSYYLLLPHILSYVKHEMLPHSCYCAMFRALHPEFTFLFWPHLSRATAATSTNCLSCLLILLWLSVGSIRVFKNCSSKFLKAKLVLSYRKPLPLFVMFIAFQSICIPSPFYTFRHASWLWSTRTR